MILNTLQQRGTIIIQDRWINYTDLYIFSPTAGWMIAAIFTALYPLSVLYKQVVARGTHIAQQSWTSAILKTVGIGDRGVRHRRDLQPRQDHRDARGPAARRRAHRLLLRAF